jgi:hypothetical protein
VHPNPRTVAERTAPCIYIPTQQWEVWRGWRVPGVKVPGVRFYAVRGRRDKTPVIWMKDETYERLVTEVEDPAKVAEKINEAVGALSRS